MNRYYYDLHTHSCLSPCGDDDATPANLAGMATLAGLQLMALTDHNTCKNCPAFFAACKAYGIVPVAGMELTTAEEIHVVRLFPTLEDAMDFDSAVDARRIKIENRTDIFGCQTIMNERDEPIGEEKHLLPIATGITLDEVPALVEHFHGVCFPAHIDRDANGIISVLGTLPESPDFHCVELRERDNIEEYTKRFSLEGKVILVDSDAHYLTDVRDKENYIELDDEPYSSALVRQRLIEYLRGEV